MKVAKYTINTKNSTNFLPTCNNQLENVMKKYPVTEIAKTEISKQP